MIKIAGENGLIVKCLVSAIGEEFKINKKLSLRLLCLALDKKNVQDVLEETITELLKTINVGE